MSGIFEAFAGATAGIGGTIANYVGQKEANRINEEYAERNARLQEDVAYNGLGIRISDAERNGISKWSVVGDGAPLQSQCSKCGAKLILGTKFCSECGEKL